MVGAAAALLAGAVAFIPPAAAETREEAAAYAFLGLAQDAALTRGQTQLTWKALSSSPAAYQGHGEGGGKKYDIKFTVTAVGACEYEIKLSGAPNVVRGGEALYARIALKDIASVKPNPDAIHLDIEGAGYCQTGTLNPNCVVVKQTDLFGAVDPAKHAAMVEQIRASECTATQ